MRLFKRSKREVETEQTVEAKENEEKEASDPLLKALLSDEDVNREMVMNIPAVSACINIIGDIISPAKPVIHIIKNA